MTFSSINPFSFLSLLLERLFKSQNHQYVVRFVQHLHTVGSNEHCSINGPEELRAFGVGLAMNVFQHFISIFGAKYELLWCFCTALPKNHLSVKQCGQHCDVSLDFLPVQSEFSTICPREELKGHLFV